MELNFQFLTPVIANVVRYILFAGIPFLIFYILFPEKFNKNRIQAKLAKRKDFIREILHSMQTNIIIGIVISIMIFTPLRAYTNIYSNFGDYPTWWFLLSVLLALIIHDTYFYWMHRAVHHPKLYKTVHLTHHKSINPSPWASFSFHFFEGITEAMIGPIVMILIPIHPGALAIFGLTSFIINVYGHLGFEVAPKWFRNSFLFEIVNTSVHHNLHHKKFKGNYGLYFRVWDRLMKTENPNYVAEYDVIQEKRFGKSGSCVQVGL